MLTMKSRNLLREYLHEVLKSAPQKKLRVFDFDDTLVKTKSLIYVTSAGGEKFHLTPGEFAVYVPDQGDQFDFSDFSKLIDPTEIKWTAKILRNIVASGGEVVILTARADAAPVHQFLEEAGIPPLEVVALGNADPQKKAEYIAGRISTDSFSHIEFFDDSYKNVSAVKSLETRFPDVKIVSRHVVHKTEIN